MHDAEIAATLLNRWQRNNRSDGFEQAVDLLREGGLSFERYVGICPETSDEFVDGAEIECLTFADGSRVLRLRNRAMVQSSTGWAAVPPLPKDDDESGPTAARQLTEQKPA